MSRGSHHGPGGKVDRSTAPRAPSERIKCSRQSHQSSVGVLHQVWWLPVALSVCPRAPSDTRYPPGHLPVQIPAGASARVSAGAPACPDTCHGTCQGRAGASACPGICQCTCQRYLQKHLPVQVPARVSGRVSAGGVLPTMDQCITAMRCVTS